MIYFRPHVRALEAHIVDLQTRLAAAETERQQLLDRLLEKHRVTPLAEKPAPTPAPVRAVQYLAPPGINPIEVQDAIRDVWIQEETDYLIGNQGFDPVRARAEAEARYNAMHGITNG